MKKRPTQRRGPSLAPRKSLGQNFLISPAVRDKIIAACDPGSDDTVVEIGPGKGVLSRVLVQKAGQVILVEKDRRMADFLKEELTATEAVLENKDILTYPLPNVPQKILLIGNIPYNISTPIIEYAIAQRERIRSCFFTVQREFGHRLAAQPGSKEYGSLSVYAQFYADVRVLFAIKNTAFFPVPKVHSCFVRMDFRSPRYRLREEEKFFRFVQQIFTQRRKTLLNAVPFAGDKQTLREVLDACGIDPKARAETLSIEDFVGLYRKAGGERD